MRPAEQPSVDPAEDRERIPTRTERKRRARMQRFVDAAKQLVADEGFDALTMQRLADDLDMSVSAAYRYFDSKGALLRHVQMEAIEELGHSLTTVRARAQAAWADLPERQAALAHLVLVGRWLCAASQTYPEDVRLLQLILSNRQSVLDPDGGAEVFPIAIATLGTAVEAVEAAATHGAISDGAAVDRAIILASALGGVLETDDLERYAPDLFGGTRLARQACLDLIAGWGADADELGRADALVDALADEGALAP